MSNRRDFQWAGGLALLTIVPRSCGGTKFVAPSDQLTKGIIGVGGIGKSSYHFTSNDACRLVAVCDVDRKHLESAIALGARSSDKTLKLSRLPGSDHRPQRRHRHTSPPLPTGTGIMAVEAAKAGKDIWCEKPMTRTIGEGKRVVEAVRQNGRIFRLNTWFRFRTPSTDWARRSNRSRNSSTVACWDGPQGDHLRSHGIHLEILLGGAGEPQPQSVPEELDYDMCGSARRPTNPTTNTACTPRSAAGDYDGGGLTDMGQHYAGPHCSTC